MRSSIATLSLATLVASLATAADWPQWRGPTRDDKSAETGLNKAFGTKAPPVAWKFSKAGIGYSGPSIAAGKVYLVGGTAKDKDADKHQDEAICLDEKTGKELWRVTIGGEYEDNGSDKNWGGGPRANPTVTEDGHVYFLGIRGDVYCLKAADGKLVWTKNYTKDFGGKLMSGWGFSESPLVDGDTIVCTPGGSKGTIVCLDRKTGATKWQSAELKDDAAYSSIVRAKLAGVDQYVNLTAKGVAGVSVDTGKLLWRYDCGDKYRVAVIPTAVIAGPDLVYATAGYGAGCDLIKISGGASGQKAEKVFANKDLVNHHGGVIFKDGFVYGHSDTKGWVCQDLKDGSLKWEWKRGGFEKGAVTYADGALFCYGENSGDLVVLEATPSGPKQIGSLKLPERTKLLRKSGKAWAHPVIANGNLYLRDQDLLYCFDLKAK